MTKFVFSLPVCVTGYDFETRNSSIPAPEYQAGLFVLKKSMRCTGRLSYVEGNGTAILSDRNSVANETNVKYRMKLHIIRRGTDRETIHMTSITTDRSGPFNQSLDLEVLAGDLIAVEVAKECIKDEGDNVTICPFLPVVNLTANTKKYIQHHPEVDVSQLRGVPGLMLTIRAYTLPQGIILLHILYNVR